MDEGAHNNIFLYAMNLIHLVYFSTFAVRYKSPRRLAWNVVFSHSADSIIIIHASIIPFYKQKHSFYYINKAEKCTKIVRA